MEMLLPLGLLGLIGIIALIIIYIIKPVFVQKHISSTFMWKRALKLKKKKIPVNKLKNILLFIIQLLIIALSAFMLSYPVIPGKVREIKKERILILDASASMLTESGGTTRFDIAKEKIEKEFENLEGDEVLTLIYSGKESEYICERLGSDGIEEAITKIEELECTEIENDIDKSLDLAKTILDENPDASIHIYTDKTYSNPNGAVIESCFGEDEFNVGILGVEVVLEEGFYSFYVTVASYGTGQFVTLNGIISGCNYNATQTFSLKKTELVQESEEKVFVFTKEDMGDSEEGGIYSFKSADFYVQVSDSYSYDDHYYVYGATPETIDVLYLSDKPTSFMTSILRSLRQTLEDKWTLNVIQLSKNTVPNDYMLSVPLDVQIELYIFENVIPDVMPEDGVVILINPPYSSNGLDVQFADYAIQNASGFKIGTNDSSEITKYITSDSVRLTSYVPVTSYNDFEKVLYIDNEGADNDPLLLVRNRVSSKIAVFPFAFNMSDVTVLKEFPILFYNLFNYFFPKTFEKNVYNVDDIISINSRGGEVAIFGPNIPANTKVNEFPYTLELKKQGTYTFQQEFMGIPSFRTTEMLYCRIPSSESDIFKTELILKTPEALKAPEEKDLDLLIYLAAGLVALLFLEWILKRQDA